MRHISSIIICLLALTACGGSEDKGYTINGSLEGEAEGARVTLLDSESPDGTPLDSAVVRDGRFTLSGRVDEPGLYTLIIDTNEPDAPRPDMRDKMLKVNFYLENSDITFKGDVASLPAYYYNPERKGRPVITGSESQSLHDSYTASIADITRQLGELDKRYSEEYIIPEMEGRDASAKGIEIVRLENELNRKKNEAAWRFIAENPASVVAFDEASYIINGYGEPTTSADIDSLLNILGKHWQGTARYEQLKETAATTRSLAIGEPYIDIDLLNAAGDTVKLSSLIPADKYVMLEFWASWCGPCRGEIPHLVKVHKKYPEFEIISISVDSDDNEWQKAMKEEGMVWTQLRNPQGMEGDVQEKYNIYGVPTCLLLDKSGRFYKTNMRGAYLDEFLSTAYGR